MFMKDPFSFDAWTTANREMRRGAGPCAKDETVFQETLSLFRLTQNGSAWRKTVRPGARQFGLAQDASA
jgi:hypothetical protein